MPNLPMGKPLGFHMVGSKHPDAPTMIGWNIVVEGAPEINFLGILAIRALFQP